MLIRFWGILLITFVLVEMVRADFVGISDQEFMPHHRAQRGQMWCWATCAEMVLSYHGITLPHEAIVQRIKGFQIDAAGNPVEMIMATNGLFADENGKQVVVSGQFVMGTPLATVLYNQMKRKRPVILTYQGGPMFGHAVVLTGIDVDIDSRSGVMIRRFHVFDPFSYRSTVDPWGRQQLIEDERLRAKKYIPQGNPLNGVVAIEPGLVTGVILVDGARP